MKSRFDYLTCFCVYTGNDRFSGLQEPDRFFRYSRRYLYYFVQKALDSNLNNSINEFYEFRNFMNTWSQQ